MKYLLVALLVAAGCSKSDGPSVKGIVGTTIVPPFGLDKLRRGMTIPEAEAAAGLEQIPGERDYLTKDSGHPDVVIEVGVGGRVHDIVLRFKKLKRPAPFLAVWGEPTSRDQEGDPVWIDEAVGWRVSVHCLLDCQVQYLPYKPLDAAFFGAAPTLPAAVGPVRFFMTEAELKAASIPEHVPLEQIDTGRSVRFDRFHRVVAVVVATAGDAMPILQQAWGAAGSTADGGRWWNPSARVRATAEVRRAMPGVRYADETHIVFEAYTPIASFLGEGDGFAFAEAPLVGGARAELDKIAPSFPGVGVSGSALYVPPFEHGYGESSALSFHFTGDKVTGVWFSIPGDEQATLALLKKKWPAAAPDPADPAKLVLRPTGPRITASTGGSSVSVQVEDL